MASANDVGSAIGKSLCWPVYGVIDDIANNRWDKAAGDLLCPTGVGGIVDAVECWEAGKAVAVGTDFLMPGVIPGGQISTVMDATGATQFITDEYNGKNNIVPNPTATTEENVPEDEAALARDSRQTASVEDDVTRKAAYRAARNAGANRAAASAMAGAQTDTSNQSAALSSARNAATGNQNDWLAKQGYANALEQQAANKRSGAFMNTLGSIFGGAGEGASVGSSLGGSK